MIEPAGLFGRLVAGCPEEWHAYAGHVFIARLSDGTLAESAFRHYLVQDYIFLIHLARAYALAACKADTLPAIREAAAMVSAILDSEMGLHIGFCARWGIEEAELAATPAAAATLAYTSYVLERGMAGDLLDLHVALSPCVVGYALIGSRVLAEQAPDAANPYREWIDTYAGEEYQAVAASAMASLDRLEAERAGPGRFGDLLATFRRATMLEARFWDMGLNEES